tara:strand:+ start:2810 stop:3223 length:414 start_codon:yes stop_codon:yes gene_type:complete
MEQRIDLMILEDTEYPEYRETIENIKKLNLGTLYVKVSIETLSETRADMVNDDYTTRLFVAKINGENSFYIYGKKKGKKGTFNEHCKNTFYEYDSKSDFLKHIINTSSNELERIVSDDKDILKLATELKREVSTYEK